MNVANNGTICIDILKNNWQAQSRDTLRMLTAKQVARIVYI